MEDNSNENENGNNGSSRSLATITKREVVSEEVLRQLNEHFQGVDNTMEKVQASSRYACENFRASADVLADAWVDEVDRRIANSLDTLPLMYVVNDVLQLSRKDGKEFLHAFEKVLPEAMESIGAVDYTLINKIDRIIKVWEERKVYDMKFTRYLMDCASGKEQPSLNIASANPLTQILLQSRRTSDGLDILGGRGSVPGTPREIPLDFRFSLAELMKSNAILSFKTTEAIRATQGYVNTASLKDNEEVLKSIKDPENVNELPGLDRVLIELDVLRNAESAIKTTRDLLQQRARYHQAYIRSLERRLLTTEGDIRDIGSELSDCAEAKAIISELEELFGQKQSMKTTTNNNSNDDEGEVMLLCKYSTTKRVKRRKLSKAIERNEEEEIVRRKKEEEEKKNELGEMRYDKVLKKYVPVKTNDEEETWRN